MYGDSGEKMDFFLVLKLCACQSTKFYPPNYIFLRSAIITLSVEHIKSWIFKSWIFQNFNFGLECMPTRSESKVSSTRLQTLTAFQPHAAHQCLTLLATEVWEKLSEQIIVYIVAPKQGRTSLEFKILIPEPCIKT